MLVYIDGATSRLMELWLCDGESTFNGISAIDEANAFAVGFVEDFNRRFGRPALSSHNAHRTLRPEQCLSDTFTWQETRKVSRQLTLNYKRVIYLLDKTQDARAAMGKQVQISEAEDGSLTIWHQGSELPARAFEKEGHVRQGAIVDNKVSALTAAP